MPNKKSSDKTKTTGNNPTKTSVAEKNPKDLITTDQVKEVLSRKNARPNNSLALAPSVDDSMVSRIASHNMQLFQLPDISLRDHQAVADRTITYFDLCIQNKMKPTIAGYSLSLGISRIYLYELAHGNKDHKPAEVVNTIKKAIVYINSQMEDYMQNGQINPVAGIFLMKNNMDYHDEQKVVVEPNIPLGQTDEKSAEKLIDDIPFVEN